MGAEQFGVLVVSVCRLPQQFGDPSHGARLLPMVSECPVVLLALGSPMARDRQTDRQTKYCLVGLGQEWEGGS